MSSPSWTTVAAPVRSSSAGMVGEDGKARGSGARPGTPGQGASQGIFGAHNQGVFNPQRQVVGLGIDDPAWDHSTFSKNRDRLLDGDIAAKFLSALLAQPRVTQLLSTEHFSVDGTLIEAWALMKSFRPKANFRGERRSNETHASTTTRMRGSTARARARKPSSA